MDSRHKKERLSSIDALRGADMFFIMGGAELVLALCASRPDAALSRFLTAQMTHVDWHGLTFYDLILPLFLSLECTYIVLWWLFLYLLYRRKIFLKV